MDNYSVTHYSDEENTLKNFTPLGEFDSNSENKIYYKFTVEQIKRHVTNLYLISEVTNMKQELYITAIKNLLKKINFLELYQEYSNDEITEDEFQKILEQESNRYTIKMNNTISTFEKNLIIQIISQIGSDIKDFSLSDIEELFSIKNNNLINTLLINQR